MAASAEVVRGRAEELGREDGLREQFDVVTSRSFGIPGLTAECGSAFLSIGGWMVVSEPPGWPAEPVADGGTGARGPRARGDVRVAGRFGYQVLRKAAGHRGAVPPSGGDPGEAAALLIHAPPGPFQASARRPTSHGDSIRASRSAATDVPRETSHGVALRSSTRVAEAALYRSAPDSGITCDRRTPHFRGFDDSRPRRLRSQQQSVIHIPTAVEGCVVTSAPVTTAPRWGSARRRPSGPRSGRRSAHMPVRSQPSPPVITRSEGRRAIGAARRSPGARWAATRILGIAPPTRPS